MTDDENCNHSPIYARGYCKKCYFKAYEEAYKQREDRKKKNCRCCNRLFMPSHRGQKNFLKAKFCSRHCQAKANMLRKWREGTAKGFKTGHPIYLLHHSFKTIQKLKRMFKGKHHSLATEFKKGHKLPAGLMRKGMYKIGKRWVIPWFDYQLNAEMQRKDEPPSFKLIDIVEHKNKKVEIYG